MALWRWPALAIDRTGIALCGAIVLLFFDAETGASAAGMDTGTPAVLFALMALSAQFAASGPYEWCAARLATAAASPAALLALRSDGHTYELKSLMRNLYAAFFM